MHKAIDTYPNPNKQIKGNIVKVRSPDRRRWGGKKFLYFSSQRQAINWFLINFTEVEEMSQHTYPQVETKFSHHVRNYMEFGGIEVKQHSGAGTTLKFQKVNIPIETIH